MVYFDARQVFASLLSCRSLNEDEHFLFHEHGDPFAAPDPRTSVIGDINSDRCYRETYKKLVRNPQSDMVLPCVLAMNKTHVDLPGRLQMEPITSFHGLLKHEFRRLPIVAMRILGYINHVSTPCKAQKVDLGFEYNEAPDNLPVGVVTVSNVLPPKKGVTWPTSHADCIHSFGIGFHWFAGQGLQVVACLQECRPQCCVSPVCPFHN